MYQRASDNESNSICQVCESITQFIALSKTRMKFSPTVRVRICATSTPTNNYYTVAYERGARHRANSRRTPDTSWSPHISVPNMRRVLMLSTAQMHVNSGTTCRT